MDPLEEVATRQIRARLWRNGELLKEEVHTQALEDYSKNELVLMLEHAGFREIQIRGDHSDEPAPCSRIMGKTPAQVISLISLVSLYRGGQPHGTLTGE